ncbi:hypothetical protein M8J75_002154 [Diaphorina citri]|nr:hypothetical protein M8J75_002154 [Diaphorina citri]
MNKKVQIQGCCCIVVILLMSGQCWARPPFSTWGVHESILDGKTTSNLCSNDSSTDYVCQQCAKQSGSSQAYPMCCDPTDDTGALVWCKSYTMFGERPNHPPT